MPVQGVLLDIDGTLVLSNDAHAQAWVEAFADHGYEVPFEQVRPLIGMGGDQVVPRLVPQLNDKEGTGKAIADRRKELIINKFGPQLTPTNGARELVQKLRSSGLNLIIATSATTQELDVLLGVAGVNDLIDEATTSSDAEASKPEPDLVEAALQKGHLEANSAVMLADTPYDIESGAKAGVGVIALRCGGFPDEQLAGAIAIYDDPADLLQHYDNSPLAQTQKDLETSAEAVASPISLLAQAVRKGRWITAQVLGFLSQLLTVFGRGIKEYQNWLLGIALILVAAIVFKILFAVLDAVFEIPLVAPFFELIGIGYSVWFVNRYLINSSTRQELSQKLQELKQQVIGSNRLPEA